MSINSRFEPVNREWTATIYTDDVQPMKLSADTWLELRSQLLKLRKRLAPTDDISIASQGRHECFSPEGLFRAIADSDSVRQKARLAKRMKLAERILTAAKAIRGSGVVRVQAEQAKSLARRVTILIRRSTDLTPFNQARDHLLEKAEELLRAAVAKLRWAQRNYSLKPPVRHSEYLAEQFRSYQAKMSDLDD